MYAYTVVCGQLLEKQVISPPCAVVLRFPLLVVKAPVALLGNGVTVTLPDMELFSSRTVEFSAVAQATTTPEDTRQESLHHPVMYS